MKKFLLGFLVGALLFAAIPVGAAIKEYTLRESTVKITVDGKQTEMSSPPVLYMSPGYNYIPAKLFREICAKIGVGFEWVSETNTIEIVTKEVTKEPIKENAKEPTKEEVPAETTQTQGLEYTSFKSMFTISPITMSWDGSSMEANVTYSGTLNQLDFDSAWKNLKDKKQHAHQLAAELQKDNPTRDIAVYFYYGSNNLGYAFAYPTHYVEGALIEEHQLSSFKENPL